MCLQNAPGRVRACLALLAAAIQSGDAGHLAFCQSVVAQESGNLEAEITAIIENHAHELLDSEEIACVIADTNATDWGIWEIGLEQVTWDAATCIVEFSFRGEGEQDEDHMYLGHEIDGTATATIHQTGNVDFSDIAAEIWHE